MTNRITIKNYDLSFGELGIQFKFKDNIKQTEIRNVLYKLENAINNIDYEFRLSKSLFYEDKDKTIDDIQN